jgi:excisionase family DNA binding protein
MSDKTAKTEDRRTTTIPEAAKRLGISANAAYMAARRGDIPCIKIGRRYLVQTAALDRMINGDR